MIIFFLGFHLVIEPKARTKLLVGTLTILLFILLFGLPLYSKFLRSTLGNTPSVINSAQQEKEYPKVIRGAKQ
jgi:hypothetical protein